MVETVGASATGSSAPRHAHGSSRRGSPSWLTPSGLVFPVLLVAGLVLRILVLRTNWSMPDGDESMGMVMALRAAHGHLSLLFWGGNYGGAGITWIEAPLVAIFGLHVWIFQLGDTALTFIAVLLLRAIGRRITSPLAADVAAGTFWFFPALWVFWSEREYVFWLPAIVLALTTGVLALRWFETRRASTLVWVGLSSGLAVWSYPLVVSLVLPPVAVILWTERRNLGSIGRVLVGGLVGLSPWVTFFVIHGRSAFTVQAATESRSSAFVHAITQVLPTALIGGQKAYDVIWSGPDASASHLEILGVAVYVGMAAFTVFAIVRRQVALACCGVAFVLWPFALAVGHVPTGVDTFRYGLIPIAPLLLVAAHLLAKLRLAPLLAVGAFVLAVATISTDTSSFAAVPACNPSYGQVVRYLTEQERTTVWASYWLAGPLEVCSSQSITASSVAPVRDAKAEAAASATPHSTYVVFPGNALDKEIAAWVAANHSSATRTIVGGRAVWEFHTNVLPTVMGLNSAF